MDLSILRTNLRRHRVAQGKSQGEVAEAAGLSRLGYRNIEAGEVAPRVDSLMRIADALDVRLEDLLVPVRQLKAVRFRAQKKMTTRGELLTEVARWLDDYCELEELLRKERLIKKTPFKLGRVRGEIAALAPGEERARKAAAAARRAVGLDHDLIRDICGLLEDNGVKLYSPQLASEGFFGLSVAGDDGGPAVVVNTWDRLSVERWIFTAAHELGHLLLHGDSATYDVSRREEDAGQEKEADLFASLFLMPEGLFDAELDEARGLPLVDLVFKLKRIFHVSWKTVLYRLSTKSGDGGTLWRLFQHEYRRRTGRTIGFKEEPEGLAPGDFDGRPSARVAEEPAHLDEADFQRDRLHRLVRLAVEHEVITMSRAAEILRIDLVQMRELVNAWVK